MCYFACVFVDLLAWIPRIISVNCVHAYFGFSSGQLVVHSDLALFSSLPLFENAHRPDLACFRLDCLPTVCLLPFRLLPWTGTFFRYTEWCGIGLHRGVGVYPRPRVVL